MGNFWEKAAEESQQQRCDIIQAEFRAEPKGRRSIRREASPLPQTLVRTDDAVFLRVAEELEYARRMLDIMGDELATDGLIVSRHVTSLQSIDIVGQMLGHIATIVRSSDPAGAVDSIGMCELKARLTRGRID